MESETQAFFGVPVPDIIDRVNEAMEGMGISTYVYDLMNKNQSTHGHQEDADTSAFRLINGDIKLFPSDFQVRELNQDGIPAYLSNENQINTTLKEQIGKLNNSSNTGKTNRNNMILDKDINNETVDVISCSESAIDMQKDIFLEYSVDYQEEEEENTNRSEQVSSVNVEEDICLNLDKSTMTSSEILSRIGEHYLSVTPESRPENELGYCQFNKLTCKEDLQKQLKYTHSQIIHHLLQIQNELNKSEQNKTNTTDSNMKVFEEDGKRKDDYGQPQSSGKNQNVTHTSPTSTSETAANALSTLYLCFPRLPNRDDRIEFFNTVRKLYPMFIIEVTNESGNNTLFPDHNIPPFAVHFSPNLRYFNSLYPYLSTTHLIALEYFFAFCDTGGPERIDKNSNKNDGFNSNENQKLNSNQSRRNFFTIEIGPISDKESRRKIFTTLNGMNQIKRKYFLETHSIQPNEKNQPKQGKMIEINENEIQDDEGKTSADETGPKSDEANIMKIENDIEEKRKFFEALEGADDYLEKFRPTEAGSYIRLKLKPKKYNFKNQNQSHQKGNDETVGDNNNNRKRKVNQISDTESKVEANEIMGETESNTKDKKSMVLSSSTPSKFTGKRKYLHFVLKKDCMEHYFSMQQLAQYMKVPFERFNYGGMKDKNAITYQFVSILFYRENVPDMETEQHILERLQLANHQDFHKKHSNPDRKETKEPVKTVTKDLVLKPGMSFSRNKSNDNSNSNNKDIRQNSSVVKNRGTNAGELKIGCIRWTDFAVKTGQNYGNFFQIRIRNIFEKTKTEKLITSTNYKCTKLLNERLERLSVSSSLSSPLEALAATNSINSYENRPIFINYYGTQRLGVPKINLDNVTKKGIPNYALPFMQFKNSYSIGQAFLQGDYETVCHCLFSYEDTANSGRGIFRGKNGKYNRFDDSQTQICDYYWISKDMNKLSGALPKNMLLQKNILLGMKKEGFKLTYFKYPVPCLGQNRTNDLIDKSKLLSLEHYQILQKIFLHYVPYSMWTMYIQGYESLLWNKVASFRIQNFGLNVIEGDIKKIVTEKEGQKKEDGQEPLAKKQKLEVEVDKKKTKAALIEGEALYSYVTKEELSTSALSTSSSITIQDIVIPLPGCDVLFPDNAVGDYYTELLRKDGTYESITESDYSNFAKLHYFDEKATMLRTGEASSLSDSILTVISNSRSISSDDRAKQIILSIQDQCDKIRIKLGKIRGSYRSLLVEAQCFSFAWMDSKIRHFDLSEKISVHDKHQKEGIYDQNLDLVLSFMLPAGSYATMFMRELMRSNNLEKFI